MNVNSIYLVDEDMYILMNSYLYLNKEKTRIS